MDTAPSDVGTPETPASYTAPGSPHLEALLEALKTAIATPGEHRLFRSGRLAGLFKSRVGVPAESALAAVREGWLEVARTETRGRIITEWVRATPKAVTFIHDHDSPKSVLRDLKQVLDATRAGIPAWMAEAKAEVAVLSSRFEERAASLLAKLNEMATSVEAALRRAETTGPAVAEPVARVVPWAIEALEYLDRRATTGAGGDCAMPELFHAVRLKFPELTLPEFHDGLRRLHDVRAVRLSATDEMDQPEYAMLTGGQMVYRVGR
jgi:hypothetical protein